MNIGELAKHIQDQAEVEGMDLIHLTSYMWFGGDQPLVFKSSALSPLPTPPGGAKLMVLLMFHAGPHEMHLYMVPVQDAPDDVKPLDRLIATDKSAPVRYTLSKTAPTLAVESMPLALFEEEIVKELRLLAGFVDDDEDTITCTKCGSEESLVHTCCSECGALLPHEDDAAVAATAPAKTENGITTAEA
jgi:hypothetical protein